ncbi:MAG TPA: hypothetical protein P5525_24965, partial [Candidatus Paceibacterota bacterium]|nr:hypothetical protein [Candidatus Paceibacterota bacterium]
MNAENQTRLRTRITNLPHGAHGIAHSLRKVGAAFFAATVAILPATTHAQGAIEAWVQRYNGPGNGDDHAQAMAVDSSGNVCVTGYSANGVYWDHVTIQYSSAGVPLWTNYHSGPDDLSQGRTAVAMDTSGNVFATGSSYGGVPGSGGSELDYVTIKYSGAGVPLWTNYYNGPANSYDASFAMAVDASGNVIVTGGSTGSGFYQDYATIAYSNAGVPLWTNRYDGPGNGWDYAAAVAVNASGNVYVTGVSDGGDPEYGGSHLDYATIAYSNAGVPLWTNRYNGPANDIDEARTVAVGGSGAVYVTGFSGQIGAATDYCVTIKYSSAGVPLWTNRYHGVPGGLPTAVAVDAAENVIVAGTSGGLNITRDWATIVYSSSGVPLWTNRYDAAQRDDYAVAVAVDAVGNAYVTGFSFSTSSCGYLTIAYSSAGMPLWTNRYDGPANIHDVSRTVAVDACGNAYVTGDSDNGSNDDFLTIKYVIPPIITRQPLSCTNAAGKTASFTVEVVGGLPLSYHWRKDGADLMDGGNISGVTTTNLQIADVQLEDAGGYSV